jgi:hypothetical protein
MSIPPLTPPPKVADSGTPDRDHLAVEELEAQFGEFHQEQGRRLAQQQLEDGVRLQNGERNAARIGDAGGEALWVLGAVL